MSGEKDAQTGFATLVVLPGGADGDAEHVRCSGQAQVLVEHQMENLPLALRQGTESGAEPCGFLGRFREAFRRSWRERRDTSPEPQIQGLADPRPSGFFASGEPDHAEPPGMQAGSPGRNGPALDHLQVGALEDILCPGQISVAAMPRPAERVLVERGKGSGEIRVGVHPLVYG